MSEVYREPSGWLQSEAKENVEQLFKDSNAFEFLDIVDTRPEARMFGSCVVTLEYTSPELPLPSGFTKWPTELSQISATPDPWVEHPNPGQPLVLKMCRLDTDIAHERDALIVTNRLFTDDADRRPPRLYGYGTSSIDSSGLIAPGEYGYLLMEHLPSEFLHFSELKERMEDMPFHKVAEFLSSFTGFITHMHEQGVTHGDLVDTGQEEHIYWNQQTEQLRVIDWSESRLTTVGDNQEIRGGILLDQEGIGQMIHELLRPHIVDADLLEEFEQINSKIAIEDGYSFTPKGTREIYTDLLRLSRLIEERNSNTLG